MTNRLLVEPLMNRLQRSKKISEVLIPYCKREGNSVFGMGIKGLKIYNMPIRLLGLPGLCGFSGELTGVDRNEMPGIKGTIF